MTSYHFDNVAEAINNEIGPFFIEKVCWGSIKKVTRH
jgi:hypothetical protein